MDYSKAEAKQAARECFTGLWAATATPFDSSGALDADALRRDLERLGHPGGEGRGIGAVGDDEIFAIDEAVGAGRESGARQRHRSGRD